MKRCCEHKKYLVTLTTAVLNFLRLHGAEMRTPSTLERGKRIAALSNALEICNDRARYFGLGINYRTDQKRKAAG